MLSVRFPCFRFKGTGTDSASVLGRVRPCGLNVPSFGLFREAAGLLRVGFRVGLDFLRDRYVGLRMVQGRFRVFHGAFWVGFQLRAVAELV